MKAILTYHSIDGSGSPISVHPGEFRRHVEWFAGGDVAIVGLDSILSDGSPPDAIAITFDDGFRNFATEAWPLLRSHDLPVTLFVPVDHVGTANVWHGGPGPRVPELPLLDWEGLGRLAEEGAAIGSHTRTHVDLRGLPAQSLDEEIEGAATLLRDRLGVQATVFAYPFGAWDRAAKDAVGKSHDIAVTTRLATLPSADADPLLLPRLDAYYYRRRGRLEAWGKPSFRAHLALRRAGRAVRSMLPG